MTEFSEMNAHDIHTRFKLPKIAAKKIEEANNFINDPNSAIKHILTRHVN